MQGGSYLGQNQWRAEAAPPAWSPSSRGWPPPASITTGSRSTAAGAYRSTSAGDPSARNRASCRTRARTRSRGCARFTTTRSSGTCRSTPCSSPGRNARFYDDWLAHPDYDAYWKPLNSEEKFDKISVPVHTFGGWFDIFSQGTLRGYVGHEPEGRDGHRPAHEPARRWGRGDTVHRRNTATSTSDPRRTSSSGPPAALVRLLAQGDRERLGQRAAVKLFVMGRNEWVYEHEYPLARTEYRPLYFSSAGHANSNRGDGRLTWEKPAPEPRATFRYDPTTRFRRGRKQLLRHPDTRGSDGPAPDRRPARRPALHLRLPEGASRSPGR